MRKPPSSAAVYDRTHENGFLPIKEDARSTQRRNQAPTARDANANSRLGPQQMQIEKSPQMQIENCQQETGSGRKCKSANEFLEIQSANCKMSADRRLIVNIFTGMIENSQYPGIARDFL